jgi:hypothetical protein
MQGAGRSQGVARWLFRGTIQFGRGLRHAPNFLTYSESQGLLLPPGAGGNARIAAVWRPELPDRHVEAIAVVRDGESDSVQFKRKRDRF